MKSTIQINSVTPKVWHDAKENKDKNFQVIIFDGNKEAFSWKDDFSKFVGQSIEVDVNTNAKGKMTLALVSGATASTPAPTNNTPTQAPSSVDVRKSAVLLAIEKHKVSGATIEGPKFWETVAEILDYLENGTSALTK